jgi:anti-sigma regulatory factor (Ser/Thr protein kinase)
MICDSDNGYPTTVLTLKGDLTYATTPIVRNSVLKALADRPETLLLDLSAMFAEDDITLTAFPTLERQASAADVSMMLIGPAALRARPMPSRLVELLMPGPAAGAAARELVDRACAGWGLDEIADVAALVATELVANAVRHARTEFSLTLTLRRRYLHLSTHDFSPDLPERMVADEAGGGRGLLIIEALTAAWGYVPTTDGKVVWATLRLPW